MYADPKLIKKHRQSMNLDDYQREKLNRLHELTGEPKAVIANHIFDKALDRILHDLESAHEHRAKRVPLSQLLSA